MSFDKEIGFNIKSAKDRCFIKSMGVNPIFHPLEERLPPGHKEPEGKILVQRPRCFNDIRAFFSTAKTTNSCLIPGQMYLDKNPLTSILLDEVTMQRNGQRNATAKLTESDYSLRFRFEIDPKKGDVTQCDYNEKSALKSAQMIGGCADRDEFEREVGKNETIQRGYNNFQKKYRDLGCPTFSNDINYSSLHAFGGYIAARTEYGFAVKHTEYPVLFVFEACEDNFVTTDNTMSEPTAKLYEFEFEPKQVWGVLPDFAQTPDGFKHFLYRSMTQIRDSVVYNTKGSTINGLSKAEIARDHIVERFGDPTDALMEQMGLAGEFYKNADNKRVRNLAAIRWALQTGHSLQDTMHNSHDDMHNIAARLHNERIRNNDLFDERAIGRGQRVIAFNDNGPSLRMAGN